MSEDGRSSPTRRELLAGGLTLAAVASFGAADAAPVADAVGSVADVKGDAAAERDGGRRALTVKEPVHAGDLLTTGPASRLGVTLGPKTSLRIGESCRLKVDQYLAGVAGEFTLEAGTMKFESTVRHGKGINFRSAYGLIAVRGTRFYAGPTRDGFGVLVGSGIVTVTAAGRTVRLRAGEGTEIAMPGSAPGTVKTWPYARVREMLDKLR